MGKSSLLNRLCERNVAIVTDIPGTTRDVLETSIDIGGYPMTLIDTAGLRNATEDQIEQEGMARAKENARLADLIIVLCCADSVSKAMANRRISLAEYVQDYMERLGVDGLEEQRTVVAINKMDLAELDLIKSDGIVPLSCKTSSGLADIVQRIETELKLMYVKRNSALTWSIDLRRRNDNIHII